MKTYRILFGLIALELLASVELPAQVSPWVWQNPLPQGLALYEIRILNENTIIAAGEWGAIVRTPNRGTTWNVHHLSEYLPEYSLLVLTMFFVSENKGWIGTDRRLFVTTNGGVTWDEQNLPDTIRERSVSSVHFINENMGWALAGIYANRYLLFTSNSGISWSVISKIEMPQLASIVFLTDSVGYGWYPWRLGNASNRIYRTSDGGRTWTPHDLEFSLGVTKLFFLNESIGWLCGTNGVILKTTDSGRSWVSQNSGVATTINSIFFVNADTGWATSEGGLILRTANGGSTWEEQQTPVSQSLQAIHFLNSRVGWVTGSRGVLLETVNGGSSWNEKS